MNKALWPAVTVRPGQFAGIHFRPDGDDATPPPTDDKAKTPPPADDKKAKGDEDIAARLKALEDENKALADFKSKAEVASKKAEREKLDEADRLKAEKEDALKEAHEARKEAVGLKFGLPEALIARLQGTTKAELEADAEALAALLPKKEATPASTSAGNGNPKAKSADGLSEKEAELADALKAPRVDTLKVLKLKTQIAKLKEQQGNK